MCVCVCVCIWKAEQLGEFTQYIFTPFFPHVQFPPLPGRSPGGGAHCTLHGSFSEMNNLPPCLAPSTLESYIPGHFFSFYISRDRVFSKVAHTPACKMMSASTTLRAASGGSPTRQPGGMSRLALMQVRRRNSAVELGQSILTFSKCIDGQNGLFLTAGVLSYEIASILVAPCDALCVIDDTQCVINDAVTHSAPKLQNCQSHSASQMTH